MTDPQPTQNTMPHDSSASAMAAIEKAKEVADRYKRQVSYLVMLQCRLPILESAYNYAEKTHRESGEDVVRLTREIAAVKDHIEKLSGWVAKNSSMPEDIEQANTLAAKIKRLQQEINRKRLEMQRLANGLPELV